MISHLEIGLIIGFNIEEENVPKNYLKSLKISIILIFFIIKNNSLKKKYKINLFFPFID